jgi:hypothetical protein
MRLVMVIPAEALGIGDALLGEFSMAPLDVTGIFNTGHERVQVSTVVGMVWLDAKQLVCVLREAA